MSNPFSDKAGKGKKPNPFSTAARKPNPFTAAVTTNGSEPDPRHRSTPKDRAAALRKAESAKGRVQQPKSVRNPWVREAFDISAQLADLDKRIDEYQKQYTQQLKVQKKAKTVEEIEHAFNRGDTLMGAVIGLSAQRRRLAGGAAL